MHPSDFHCEPCAAKQHLHLTQVQVSRVDPTTEASPETAASVVC
jgi:hypothetical protein